MEQKKDKWFVFTYIEIIKDFDNNDPVTGGYAIFGTEVENQGWRIGSISHDFSSFRLTYGSNIPKSISKYAIAEINKIFELGQEKIDNMLLSNVNYFDDWKE